MESRNYQASWKSGDVNKGVAWGSKQMQCELYQTLNILHNVWTVQGSDSIPFTFAKVRYHSIVNRYRWDRGPRKATETVVWGECLGGWHLHSSSSECFGRLIKQGISHFRQYVGSFYHPSFRELVLITFVLTNFCQWACCSLTYFLVVSNLPIPLRTV